MKFSLIPKQTNSQPSPIHTSQSVPVIPPTYPHPPRPVSYSQNMNMEDGFVVVRPSPEPPVNPSGESTDFYSTVQRATSLSQAVQNPLSGVPFEINPMYDCGKKFNLLVIISLFFAHISLKLMLNFTINI